MMPDLGYENTAERVEEDARVLKAHLRVAEGRVLVASEGVEALGLAVEGTEAGDVVCVVDGARMPIILRERDVGWEVIGEAYWEGVMYGEVDREQEQFREFVLV